MTRASVLKVMASTACAAAIGCATPSRVTYSAINAPPRPFVRRAPDEVEVTVGKPPSRPSVDVGLFEVAYGTDDYGTQVSTKAMLATLREHAALRGCDAVQILNVEVVNRYDWRVVRGVCEIYTDAQATSRAASAPPAPLPDEGKSCTVEPDGSFAPQPCPDPLVCSNSRCVSPYR